MYTYFSLLLKGQRGSLSLTGREKAKVRPVDPLYIYTTHQRAVGWRGNFLLSAAEQWLKLELSKNFKVCEPRSSDNVLIH
jgi:hypothetical protein